MAGTRLTPDLIQIREALSGSHLLVSDEIALPIWESEDPFGIGLDSEACFVLVLRSCESMRDISGSHFSFHANVIINVRGIGLHENVSVLRVSSRTTYEVDLEAIAAVFLGLIEISRDKSVSLSRVIACFETLFETGKASQTSPETLIGLVGELLVISKASNKDFVLSCWGSGERDRFDFSNTGERLEVKSTIAAERVHRFNSKQVPGPVGCQVVIASVLICEVDVGQTLTNLVDNIKDQLLSENAKAKLIEKTMLILNGPIESQTNLTFDLEASSLSVSYYLAEDIPRPIPKSGVISMEWTALMPVTSTFVPSGPLIAAALQIST
jgi:hypothetical protein